MSQQRNQSLENPLEKYKLLPKSDLKTHLGYQ